MRAREFQVFWSEKGYFDGDTVTASKLDLLLQDRVIGKQDAQKRRL